MSNSEEQIVDEFTLSCAKKGHRWSSEGDSRCNLCGVGYSKWMRYLEHEQREMLKKK